METFDLVATDQEGILISSITHVMVKLTHLLMIIVFVNEGTAV